MSKIVPLNASPNALITDGRIEPFNGGWAMAAFTWRKAHYFNVTERFAISACESLLRWRTDMFFRPGNFPYCKKCARIMPAPDNVRALRA